MFFETKTKKLSKNDYFCAIKNMKLPKTSEKLKKERKYQESENFVNFSLSFFVLFEKFVVIDMKIIVMVNISQN